MNGSGHAYLASPADFGGTDDIITNLTKERQPWIEIIERISKSLIITYASCQEDDSIIQFKGVLHCRFVMTSTAHSQLLTKNIYLFTLYNYNDL